MRRGRRALHDTYPGVRLHLVFLTNEPGASFLPTDTLPLALLLVGCFLTIFWVTALFGRVWCGWAGRRMF